jgi:membrane protease YdiL (CAAX protease family)
LEKTLFDQKLEDAPWTLPQTLIGFFLSLIPRVVFTLGLSLLSGGSVPTTGAIAPSVDLANALILFILNGLVEVTFLIGPIYMARRVLLEMKIVPHPRTVLEVLSFRRFKASTALPLVVFSFLAIFAINWLYQLLIVSLHLKLQTNDQTVLQLGRVAPISMYSLLFLAVFVAPFCEEVLFRGFLFAGFLRAMPLGLAVVLSAFIFAAAHGDLASFPVLFCIGVLLAFLRWRTGSLWPGILLHLLNNAWSAISIILVLHGVG